MQIQSIFVFILIMLLNKTEADKKLMWLDCDPGHDDAMAIYMAAYAKNIKLIGISTVHGNSSIEKVTNNALKVLQMGGIYDIPVYKGSANPLLRKSITGESIHGESGIDGCVLPETDQKAITSDVFQSIYEKIKSQPKKVHFAATGGLTNLALLLTTFPDFKDYIEQISIMGGAIGLGNWFPSSEFNIAIDPEASKIVFTSGVPLTMAPLDLTLTVQVTDEVTKRIKQMNSKFSENILGLFSYWLQQRFRKYNQNFLPMHDPCAVYYLINPEAFTIKLRNVVIETKSEYCDGRTVVDEYSVTDRQKNTYITVDVDREKFWNEMLYALEQANENSPINDSGIISEQNGFLKKTN